MAASRQPPTGIAEEADEDPHDAPSEDLERQKEAIRLARHAQALTMKAQKKANNSDDGTGDPESQKRSRSGSTRYPRPSRISLPN